MPRPGSTAARGYGREHQRIRDMLLAQLVDGEPCDQCYQPMYHWQALDAAHPHDQPVDDYPDSRADHLEHASCNRRAGKRATATTPKTRLLTSRDW